MKSIAVWSGAGLLAFSGLAMSQEMKCSQVFMNPSETRICESAELQELDQEMAQAYRRAEPHMPDIKKTQKVFRKALKSCKGDDACLIRSYDARNAELRAFINTLPMATEEEAQALGAAADEVAIERGETPVVEETPPPPREVHAPVPVYQEPVQESSLPPVVPDTPLPIQSEQSGFPWWVYLLGAFAVFVVLAWISAALFNRCPKCGKLSAGVELKQSTNAFRDFRTITRTDKRLDPRGQLVGTTKRREQIQMLIEDTTHYMRCKFCRHEWSYETRSESQ